MLKFISTSNYFVRKYSNIIPNFYLRFSTPSDKDSLSLLLKKGFHDEENLVNLLKLSYEETKPMYDLVLANDFTINNSLCAINEKDEICGALLYKIITKDDRYKHYNNEKEDEIFKEIISKNDKLRRCFEIQYNTSSNPWYLFPDEVKSIWKTVILAVLPEYRKMKVGSYILKEREKLCMKRFPDLYGDVCDCTTIMTAKMSVKEGYTIFNKVPYSSIGLPPASDGSDSVIGTYKLFPNYFKKD
uniref:N-acetyltransferase domain-containing protein n=1 Tax=Parastrongyloides trichosuri TaxID=131310 RepID=A0A0N4ZD38_PARTI